MSRRLNIRDLFDWAARGTMIPMGMVGIEVHNPSDTAIDDLDLVYFSDKHADRRVPDVALAQGTSSGRYAQAIARGDIAAGEGGWVSFEYVITGVNTGSATAGDAVYLDDGTAGNWTLTKPTGTDKVQRVGEVLVVDASDGVIVINIPSSTQQITHNHSDDAEGSAMEYDSGTALNGYAQGKVLRGGATGWEAYDAKTAGFILKGDGTDVASVAFDWDDLAAGAGADMAHAHSSAGEGGQLDWDVVWSDAAHDHSSAAEGGQLVWSSVWSSASHDHSSAGQGGEVPLASLGGYTRGYIIVGGPTDWLEVDARGSGHILVGDGTDLAAGVFDWDTLAAGAGADMVHDHSSDAEGGALTAADVDIADAGGHYTATEVETALDEIHHRLDALENP